MTALELGKAFAESLTAANQLDAEGYSEESIRLWHLYLAACSKSKRLA